MKTVGSRVQVDAIHDQRHAPFISKAQQLLLLHAHGCDERQAPTHTDHEHHVCYHTAQLSLPDRLQPLMPASDEDAAPCPAVSESDSRARLSARPSAMIASPFSPPPAAKEETRVCCLVALLGTTNDGPFGPLLGGGGSLDCWWGVR